jgi:hypothetical protein
MAIRNFEDIHSIRKELRVIHSGCNEDKKALVVIKRLLLSRAKVSAADKNLLNVRLDYSKVPKPSKETKVAHSAIEKLSQLLTKSKEKSDLAEHIHQLLQNHFNTEDGAVIKKLTDLSKQLVKETKELSDEAEKTLSEQGAKLTPKDFKNIVEEVRSRILGEFDTPTENISIKYYVSVDNVKVGDEPLKRLLYMAYIVIKNFKEEKNLRNLVIVLSRRVDQQNRIKDFVRTFTHEISPASIIKNNLGVEFNGDSDRAFDIIMTSLKVDNIIDVIEPSAIPIKKDHLKSKNPNIRDQEIDEDNGVITYYLNTTVSDEKEANRILQDVFVETTKLIKAVHPRKKNPITVRGPFNRKVNVKLKKGGIEKRIQFYFKLMFSKPDNPEGAHELPRNLLKKFMTTLKIESPEAANELNVLLKRFVGA